MVVVPRASVAIGICRRAVNADSCRLRVGLGVVTTAARAALNRRREDTVVIAAAVARVVAVPRASVSIVVNAIAVGALTFNGSVVIVVVVIAAVNAAGSRANLTVAFIFFVIFVEEVYIVIANDLATADVLAVLNDTHLSVTVVNVHRGVTRVDMNAVLLIRIWRIAVRSSIQLNFVFASGKAVEHEVL